MGISTNTNFPAGFAGGVTIRNMPLLSAYPGKVFWVSSTANPAGGKGTFDRPFSTVALALAVCTAGKGDIIMVKAGHAESITSTTTLACNIAGVAIIGLGSGNSRPTFTYTTANTATIIVSAANVSMMNLKFISNFLSVAAAITLTTAKYFTIQNCDFYDTAAATDFLQCINGTGAANTTDGFYMADCRWFGTGVTSVTSMVLIADALSDVTLLRNRAVTERIGDFPILFTQTTGAAKNFEAGFNVAISKQTACTLGGLLSVGALSTGSVYNNYQGTLLAAGDKLFVTTVGLFAYENRVAGVVGATGFVIPAVDS